MKTDSLALIVEDSPKHREAVRSAVEKAPFGKWDVLAFAPPTGTDFLLPDVRNWLARELKHGKNYERVCLFLDLSWNVVPEQEDKFLHTLLCPESVHMRLESEALPDALQLLQDDITRGLDNLFIVTISSFGLESMKSLCRFLGADGVIQKHPCLDQFFSDSLDGQLWNRMKPDDCPRTPWYSPCRKCGSSNQCEAHAGFLKRLIVIRKSQHKILLANRIEELIQRLHERGLVHYKSSRKTGLTIRFKEVADLRPLIDEVRNLLHLKSQDGQRAFDLDANALREDLYQFFDWMVNFPNRSGKISIRSGAQQLALALKPDAPQLIGTSLIPLLDDIEKYGAASFPVLIVGETGTGKEEVAKALHLASDRKDAPFVALNMAELTESIAESQLFGHVKGAFTGADRDRLGWFSVASKGTLFLDEIGESSLNLQAKLLRVLQDGTFHRVGDQDGVLTTNARILAATDRDLVDAVRERTFRKALYYRLTGAMIKLAPLRERMEDFDELVNHFVSVLSHKYRACDISREARDRLRAHRWPGNIRELLTTLEDSFARTTGITLNAVDLRFRPCADASANFVETAGPSSVVDPRHKDADFIRRMTAIIRMAHSDASISKTKAAEMVGMTVSGLKTKLERLAAFLPPTPTRWTSERNNS